MPRRENSFLRKKRSFPLLFRAPSFFVHSLLSLFLVISLPLSAVRADEAASPASSGRIELPERSIQLRTEDDIAWKALWDEARQLVRAGRPAAAVPLYEKLLAMRQGLEAAQWELARLLLQMGREDAAVRQLELLVEMAPGNLDYLLTLAETLGHLGAGARSAELYRRVLLREPDNPQALSGLALALVGQGKGLEALPLFEALWQRDPNRPGLCRDLGRLYYALGEFEKATPLLLSLAREENAESEDLFWAARVLDRRGLEKSAAEQWERLAGRAPKNPEIRAQVAAYYLRAGTDEKALPYLLPLLQEGQVPPQLFKRLGTIYLGMQRPREALAYFERYVEVRPKDKEVLRQMVELHAALGNRTRSLHALDRFLSLEANPDLEELARAAALHEESGGYRQAVALYDRILLSTPDDPQVLAKRAKALLAAGDEAEAEAMWAYLSSREKLLEVLEILHAQEPGNSKVLERLARMYIDRGELARSLPIFARLAALGTRSPAILVAEASVHERLQRAGKALALYEEALAGGAAPPEVRLRCLRLAGRLGLQEKVLLHDRALEESRGFPAAPEERLQIAEALGQAQLFSEAEQRYAQLLAEFAGDALVRSSAFLGLARLYRARELPFEEEQALRQAYLAGGPKAEVLAGLFGLALTEKRFPEAELWLAALESQGESFLPGGDSAPGCQSPGSILLFRARLLAAQGESRGALKLLRSPGRPLPAASAGGAGDCPPSSAGNEACLLATRLLLEEGRLEEAESLLSSCSARDGDFSVQVLRFRLARGRGRTAAAEELLARVVAGASEDPQRLLQLLSSLHAHNLYPEVWRIADEAARLHPASIALSLFAARARLAHGESRAAIPVLEQVIREFPEHELAGVLLAREYFHNGRFPEALSLSGSGTVRPDLTLLRARILWAQQEWKEAARIYAEALEPGIAEQIKREGQVAGVELPLREEESLWRRLVVAEIDRETPLDRMMRPEGFLARDAAPGAALLASHYAGYRWEKRFALEQEAREALLNRDYLAAGAYLRRLVREYPEDPSLRFDLAGVYSRFGQLGNEAALYGDIVGMGVEFPGVEEAWQRNDLKRRPSFSLGYGYRREDGRGGHKALRSTWQEGRLRYAHRPQQSWEGVVSRLEYRDLDRPAGIQGSRALLAFESILNEHLTVRAGGGGEALEDGQPDTLLLDLAVDGRLSDRLTGSLSYGRDANRDTLASLRRNIIEEEYKAKLAVDLLSSLQVGGGLSNWGFSDSNAMQGYDFWAAYTLFLDPASLRLSYTHDYRNADSAGGGGPLLVDGFASSEHPYWTPVDYWENRFSIAFRHQLSADQFGRGVPSYYDLEYSLAYDGRGLPSQSWRGGFFVELTPHVMLEATAELLSGEEYRVRQVFLGAAYRW